MSKDRKQIILQSLAKLLEERDATKITTAVLASESGITEARTAVVILVASLSSKSFAKL
jgi:hypothetical protein